MAYLIGVVHRAQAEMARSFGVVAFSHGREAPVRRLAQGDRVILYAPKTDFEGAPVQAFVAHATVTGAAPYEKAWDGEITAWVRDAAYDAVTEVPVRPFLDALSFVRDPKHWGMAFRQGKFEIPEADYRLIAGALLGAAP